MASISSRLHFSPTSKVLYVVTERWHVTTKSCTYLPKIYDYSLPTSLLPNTSFYKISKLHNNPSIQDISGPLVIMFTNLILAALAVSSLTTAAPTEAAEAALCRGDHKICSCPSNMRETLATLGVLPNTMVIAACCNPGELVGVVDGHLLCSDGSPAAKTLTVCSGGFAQCGAFAQACCSKGN